MCPDPRHTSHTHAQCSPSAKQIPKNLTSPERKLPPSSVTDGDTEAQRGWDTAQSLNLQSSASNLELSSCDCYRWENGSSVDIQLTTSLFPLAA